MKDRRPMRVLLLHEGWEAALYLTVELARLGVRVTLAGSSEPSLLRRYAEAVRAVDIRSAPGREGLSQLIGSTPWDAVIASTEELLFAVFDSRAVPIEKIWPRLDPKFLPIMRDRRLVDQFVRSLGLRAFGRVIGFEDIVLIAGVRYAASRCPSAARCISCVG